MFRKLSSMKRHKWTHIGPGEVYLCDNCKCVRKGKYSKTMYYTADMHGPTGNSAPPCVYTGLAVNDEGQIEPQRPAGGNPNQLTLF